MGKPTGRDAALGRPNAALQAGIDSCQQKRADVIAAVRELLGPPTPENEALHRLVEEVTRPVSSPSRLTAAPATGDAPPAATRERAPRDSRGVARLVCSWSHAAWARE